MKKYERHSYYDYSLTAGDVEDAVVEWLARKGIPAPIVHWVLNEDLDDTQTYWEFDGADIKTALTR